MTKKEKTIIIEKAIELHCYYKSCEENYGNADEYTQRILNQWSGIYDIIKLLGIEDDYIKELF